MLRAWRHFDRFQPGTNCKAWLFRIMLNCWTTRHQQIRQEAIQFFPEQYAENTDGERRPPTRFTAEEIQNSIDLLTRSIELCSYCSRLKGSPVRRLQRS